MKSQAEACTKPGAIHFDDPEFAGIDALLNQKPPTAFPGLSDERFRRYAFSVMSRLIEI